MSCNCCEPSKKIKKLIEKFVLQVIKKHFSHIKQEYYTATELAIISGYSDDHLRKAFKDTHFFPEYGPAKLKYHVTDFHAWMKNFRIFLDPDEGGNSGAPSSVEV